MDEVNRGKKRYTVAFIQKEFDFEAPADENQVPDDGEITNAGPDVDDAELNGRLTMRDAILVREVEEHRHPAQARRPLQQPARSAGWARDHDRR